MVGNLFFSNSAYSRKLLQGAPCFEFGCNIVWQAAHHHSCGYQYLGRCHATLQSPEFPAAMIASGISIGVCEHDS